jgi:hypothetical protein
MAVFEKTEIIGLHDDNYLKKGGENNPDFIRFYLTSSRSYPTSSGFR